MLNNGHMALKPISGSALCGIFVTHVIATDGCVQGKLKGILLIV